ncbi:MAG: alanine--tRNA ligase, partial [Armatimonadetes bacterium]|nr:alanine--tRNA ligase [Armatimonadota bacterium]
MTRPTRFFADNFWGPIGASGPCGPCSEIFIDRGADVGCGNPECAPGCDCDRYTEFWNLVFPGLNRLESGQFVDLPNRGIDTGMGLERLTMVLQNVDSPFETDLFKGFMEILRNSEKETPHKAALDLSALTVSRRIIADHVRAVVFMMGDGIPPGNEGRGYVLRRIFRRALRFSRLLGVDEPLTRNLVPELIRTMKGPYPELAEREPYILRLVDHEEKTFQRTLQEGEGHLARLFERLAESGKGTLSGDDAFKLYDTFGFPLELTREMALERGFDVDLPGFEEAMAFQRNRARQALAEKLSASADISLMEHLKETSSSFVGYETLRCQARVLLILCGADTRSELREGEEGQVVL